MQLSCIHSGVDKSQTLFK